MELHIRYIPGVDEHKIVRFKQRNSNAKFYADEIIHAIKSTRVWLISYSFLQFALHHILQCITSWYVCHGAPFSVLSYFLLPLVFSFICNDANEFLKDALSCISFEWLSITRHMHISELILGLLPVNERRRYFVTTSLMGWVQA